MTRLLFIVVWLTTSVLTMAQNRTITGEVLDGSMNNEPLPGASVTFNTDKGRGGVTTNQNGKFEISVPATVKSIVVTFMGFEKKTVAIKPNRQHYSITLDPDARQMKEVVKTGYQNIDRRQLTAAVTTIKIDESATGAIKNIDQALAGQIAGLAATTTSGAPGAPMKIRIRGIASINGTQDPLWVVDGLPLEGTDIPAVDNLNDIDDIYQTTIAGISPADIESVTVLKDAAATAIYGARAANGVIVITTKRGKAGRNVVNFNAKLTVSPRVSLDRLDLLTSDQKVGLELDLLRSAYNYRSNKGGVARILTAAGETQTYIDGGFGALSPSTQAAINELRSRSTDWNKELLRGAVGQEYNVSFSGGSEQAHYYASAGYYSEQGTVRGVDNSRLNMTLKADFRVNRALTIGASVFANGREQSGFLTETSGYTNPIYYSRMAAPYAQLYDENGGYIYDHDIQDRSDEQAVFNTAEERANTSKRRRDRSVLATVDAELKLPFGLKATTQFGIQYDAYRLDKKAENDSYAMRRDKERATYGGTCILPDGGFRRTTDGEQVQWLWKGLLEWRHVWQDEHELQLMAGSEVRHNDAESTYSAAYGYDDRSLTTLPVIFPSESIARQWPLYTATHTENAYVSWFATASYTAWHRYTLGGNVRWDGCDVWGVAKKYRYLPLYSVSALWRAGDEPWMKNAVGAWMDELNVRASYGLQGNIDRSTSPYLVGRWERDAILPGGNDAVINTGTAPNPDLRWEKTKNVNVGLEMSLLQGRLHFVADYYYRRSTDLISQRTLPLETGFAATTINWANMENRGVELSVGATPVKTADWRWNTNVNVGWNTNKVLNETVAENETYPGREGYPVGAIFAYRTAGLDSDGYPLYVAADGSTQTAKEFFKLNDYGASMLTAEEQRAQYTYMGSTDPKCSGGWLNEVTWQNVSLGVNFVFNLGAKVRVQPSYSPVYYDRGLNTNTDILDRRSANNPNGSFACLMTDTPERKADYNRYALFNTYSMLDTWVRDCNYLRLQSLRLAYRLPSRWLKPIGISSASVSAEGRNLFVIASNYDHYLDPETMGNPFAQPVARTFIFGINIQF